MAMNRMLLAVGAICLIASAHAQTTPLGALGSNNLQAGNYLVNGTGVVYDANAITLFVQGVAIQTIPRNALAPGPSHSHLPGHDHDHDDDKDKDDKDKDNKDKDDKDKDDKDKDDKDNKDKDDKDKPKPLPGKTAPPPPPRPISPAASPTDKLALEQTISKPENPLYSVVIGRKMRL